MQSLPLLALVGIASSQTPAAKPVNVYELEIGRPGRATVQTETLTDLRTLGTSTFDDVAKAAENTRFVYLGESHDQLKHHQMQAGVIEALVRAGRDVVVGFEMFTRPFQDRLNPWTLGWWTEEEFIQKADWKTNWGMDFALYRPIFEATRKHRLPMVALNLPREMVRRVSRGGWEALTTEEQAQVPKYDLENKDHFKIFEALMQGHPTGGTGGIYRGQVLWDVAMADSAMKYLKARPANSKTVFVVVAGVGHVMYGQGINSYITKWTGDPGITVSTATSDGPMTVSRGVGDFIYVTK